MKKYFENLFHNERVAYEQIFPKLGWTELFPKYIAIICNITELCNSFIYFWRYYCSEIGDTKSFIILGDFGEEGWRMCKQMANLSLEHILVSGELHYI